MTVPPANGGRHDSGGTEILRQIRCRALGAPQIFHQAIAEGSASGNRNPRSNQLERGEKAERVTMLDKLSSNPHGSFVAQ